MTNKKSNGNNNDKGVVYIPTHRDETAMNGAPDLFWLVGENDSKSNGKVNVGPP